MIAHRRRDAGGVRRLAGSQFIEPHHLMHRNVVSQPGNIFSPAIAHQIIHIGNTAAKDRRLNRAGPEAQCLKLFQMVCHDRPAPP